MINYQINEEIEIPVDSVKVFGELIVPENAHAIIVFAHGSGSSRHSSRNKFVAKALQKEGFATLLFDLLTVEKDWDYSKRFDIALLKQRLVLVSKWLQLEPRTEELSIGYFGASTGAAATLEAAAVLPDIIKAIVSRGGRPDLAAHVLPLIKAPTLLIVGGFDYEVISLNKQAYSLLRSEKELVIVEEATHLFDEPGKLEEVAALAGKWFHQHLDKQLKADKPLY